MSELVGSACLGLADLITDAITYARLRSGEVAVPSEGYKAAYVAILCVGAVTTTVSLAYRLRNARLVRAHVLGLGEQGRAKGLDHCAHGRTANASEARQKEQQYQWELEQTHRTKVLLSVSLLTIVAQGTLPLKLPLVHESLNMRWRRQLSAALVVALLL